nr:LD-carboxypeptidase [Candidatus Megaera polyxenophila]
MQPALMKKEQLILWTSSKDPEVSLIITTNGGTCSIRTLPLLDYDLITQNPKLIVGYSDATALQVGIHAKTGALSLTGFNCSDIKNGTVAENTWSSLTCQHFSGQFV